MDKEKIRSLEPKYTGNTRHLTEGEAAGIVNDPANQEQDDDTLLSAAGIVLSDTNDGGL